MCYRASAVYCVMSLCATLLGCNTTELAPPDSTQPADVAQFALAASALPDCKKNTDGEVWYVWSENKFYVCDGTAGAWKVTVLDGYDAAVRVVPGAAGSACPSGGALVQFGIDRNRNKVLDDGELTTSATLCNGAMGGAGPQGMQGLPGTPGQMGENGAPGLNALIQLTAEPAGSHCPEGGVKLETGLDSDNSGGLDTTEVVATQTRYVCNGVAAANGGSGGSGGTGGTGGEPGSCAPCLPGSQPCGDVCVDLESDQQNCGSCGKACASGTACKLGICTLSCGPGSTACNGACVTLARDPSNCGGCGVACPAGNVCAAGTCVLSCETGLTDCSRVCRDLQTDNANCGFCARACVAGTVCHGGVCSVSCASGMFNCNGQCVNLQTDDSNCGRCGATCSPGNTCSSGACVATCGAGNTACHGSCVNLQNDPRNCGACDNVCMCMSGQTPVCSSSRCFCL